MQRSRIIASCAFVIALTSCSKPSAEPDAAAVAAATTRAEAAARSLTSALIGELSKALEAGSPAEAVTVCADVAQSITIRNGGEDGFVIRRTALKLRNPINEPTAWERGVLERWSGEQESTDWSEVAETPEGHELHWMRPIRLLPMCSACHGTPGEQIAPATLAAIQAHYPNDRATGFAPGDLRGAIVVRAPLP